MSTQTVGPGIWLRPRPHPTRWSREELERSAGRAQARGGVAAAAAFLQRAVGLSADPRRRTERALAAAELSFLAGELDTAQRLLGVAGSVHLDGLQAASSRPASRQSGALVLSYGRDARAAPAGGGAPARRACDLELARGAYLTAYSSAMSAAHLGQANVFLDICRAIEHLPQPQEGPDAKCLLLEGLARLHTDGRVVATPILQRAAKRGRAVPRRGRPAVGGSGPHGQPGDLGLGRRERDLRAPGQDRASRRCARGAADASVRLGPGQDLERGPCGRQPPHRGERHGCSRDRDPASSVRGAPTLGHAGEGGRRLRTDRGHDRSRHHSGPGAGGAGGPMGGRGPVQRPRPVRRGAGGRARGDHERQSIRTLRCGRSPSWSRRQHGLARPTSRSSALDRLGRGDAASRYGLGACHAGAVTGVAERR